MTTAVSRSRPIRRSRTEMQEFRADVAAVLEEIQPATVRQLYYQLVSRAVIEKTEAAYKGLVHNLTVMRRAHEIPFDWLADNTRWMRKPRTYSSLQAMLESQQEFYRRALWDQQDCYVEIWLEKDALAGVLVEITDQWDVPLMVTRGYPSLSYLHSAATLIAAKRKPTFLYYFGDYDPSGVDITRAVEDGIRELAPDADITFERVAVIPEQIVEMKLPTRPTKETDVRSKNFEGESVEVDAIAPNDLRSLANDCIVQHIDADALDRLNLIEDQERLTLVEVIKNLPEFQAKRLTVRELPNDEDRQRAADIGTRSTKLQVLADIRVLQRDAPDLYDEASRWKITFDEAMQMLEARKRCESRPISGEGDNP